MDKIVINGGKIQLVSMGNINWLSFNTNPFIFFSIQFLIIFGSTIAYALI